MLQITGKILEMMKNFIKLFYGKRIFAKNNFLTWGSSRVRENENYY